MPRLFFALQPQPAQRAAIHRAVLPIIQTLGAQSVSEANLHLTLAFLGEVSRDSIPGLQRAAALVPVGRIQLAFTCLDWWERSGVLCLLPEETTEVRAVQRLAQDLGAVARIAGVTAGDRIFRPHVTVARKAPRVLRGSDEWPQRLSMTLPFCADGFVLMESTRTPEGQHYKVLHALPAAPGDV